MRFLNWLKPKLDVRATLPDGGVTITTSSELAEYLQSGGLTKSGVNVTPSKAMQVGAVFRSVAIIAGAVANMPLSVKRRVDPRTREDASDHWLWSLLRKKPNSWMTSSGFRRLMTTHVLLRGNAYALKVKSMNKVIQIIPLNPDRMKVTQLDTLELVYEYEKKSGDKIVLPQEDIFHLMCFSSDGITGQSPISYAKEAVGLSLQTEAHAASLFKNGTTIGSILKHPKSVSPEMQKQLRESLEAYRGAENGHKALILPEDMDYMNLGMTQEDAQFVETRKSSRTDIAMFFGVPPSMLGDTEKSTSWGTGIEQQSIGFITYTLQDYLTMWEETIDRDLITETTVFVRFNTSGLLRGDIKTRWEAYVKAMQWGVSSPNDIRAKEDENPRDGGDVYYEPPNASGTKGAANEPQKPTKN